MGGRGGGGGGGGRNSGRLQHVSYLSCMASLKSMTSLNSFSTTCDQGSCMLSRKQYFIKSAFGEKTTTDGGQKYSSLNDVAV